MKLEVWSLTCWLPYAKKIYILNALNKKTKKNCFLYLTKRKQKYPSFVTGKEGERETKWRVVIDDKKKRKGVRWESPSVLLPKHALVTEAFL